MITEKNGGGVRITQATGPNTYLTMDPTRNQIGKSGRVVEVNVRLTVNTAFTPSENTQLFILPFRPMSSWMQLSRLSGLMDNSNDTGRAEIEATTGKVIWGSAPYNLLSVGTRIWVTGTFLTND